MPHLVVQDDWRLQPQHAVQYSNAVGPASQDDLLIHWAAPFSRYTRGGTGQTFTGEPQGLAVSAGGSGNLYRNSTISGYPMSFVGRVMARDVTTNGVFTTIGSIAVTDHRVQIDVNAGSLRCIAVGSATDTMSRSVAINTWYNVVYVMASSTDRRLYVDGILVSSSTTSVTFSPAFTRTSWLAGVNIGNPTTGFGKVNGAISIGQWVQYAITGDVAERLSANPWQIFEPEPIQIYWSSAAGGATINAPSTNITVAAVAPSVSAGKSVAVPAANITVAAVAPSVTTGLAVSVPAANVAIAAVAPSVSAGKSVAVPAAAITIAAVAPTVEAGAVTTVNVPSVDIAVLAVAPSVSAGKAVAVPAVNITIAAVAPSVTTASELSGRSRRRGRRPIWELTGSKKKCLRRRCATNLRTSKRLPQSQTYSPYWTSSEYCGMH